VTEARYRSCCTLVLLLSVACSSAPDFAVGEPYAASLTGASREVRELIEGLIASAAMHPPSAADRAALGMAYEVNGFREAALKCYQQAAALDPDEPRFSYYLAQSRASGGDLEAALAALDRVHALAADYAPAYLYRGQWSLDLGRISPAFEAFRKAAELEPDHPAGWIGQARVLIKRDQGAEAARILENLAPRFRHPYIHQLLGLAYRQQGDLERARVAFARGKPGGRPGWPDPWHEQKSAYQTGFAAELLKAELLMERGQVRQALSILEALEPDHSDDVTLLNNLSIAYRGTGQAQRSFEVLQRALTLHPEYFAFHLNIATAYQQQGNLEQALQHVGRAIASNPTLAQAHVMKATYLMQAKRFDEALEAFDTALLYDAANARTLLSAGIVAAETGRWSYAAQRLERAIELEPNLVTAHLGLGRVRAEQGDFAAADRAVQRARELSPQHSKLSAIERRIAQLRAKAP